MMIYFIFFNSKGLSKCIGSWTIHTEKYREFQAKLFFFIFSFRSWTIPLESELGSWTFLRKSTIILSSVWLFNINSWLQGETDGGGGGGHGGGGWHLVRDSQHRVQSDGGESLHRGQSGQWETFWASSSLRQSPPRTQEPRGQCVQRLRRLQWKFFRCLINMLRRCKI